jgi:hypothetical protein
MIEQPEAKVEPYLEAGQTSVRSTLRRRGTRTGFFRR